MVSDRRIFIHFLLTPQAVTAGFAILDPLYAFPLVYPLAQSPLSVYHAINQMINRK